MFLHICDLGFVIAGILRLNLIAQRSTLVFVLRYLEFSSSLLCLMIMLYVRHFSEHLRYVLWNLYRPETHRSFDVMAAGEVVSSSDSLSGSVTSGGTKKRKYQTEESKKMKRPEIISVPA